MKGKSLPEEDDPRIRGSERRVVFIPRDAAPVRHASAVTVLDRHGPGLRDMVGF